MKVAAVGFGDADAVAAEHSDVARVNARPSGQSRSMPTTPRPRSRPGILLDRDGTIIVDHGHVGSIDRVENSSRERRKRSQDSTAPPSRCSSDEPSGSRERSVRD